MWKNIKSSIVALILINATPSVAQSTYSFKLPISGIKPPPFWSLTDGALDYAIEDRPYTATLNRFVAVEGSLPFSWSAENMPEWLNLNTSNGQISGTPQAGDAGIVTFNITAQYKSKSDTASITINIYPTCTMLSEAEDGRHLDLCESIGTEWEGKSINVAQNEPFEIDAVYPKNAFSCKFANHHQAKSLASFTGASIYTPYGSWNSVGPKGRARDEITAIGRARYINRDGVISQTPMYHNAVQAKKSWNYFSTLGRFNPGTMDSLLPITLTSPGGYAYYLDYDVERNVAYKACKIVALIN